MILVFALCLSCMAVNAQKKITVDVSGLPLREVVEQIKGQTGYEFVFTDNNVDLDKIVTLNLNDVSIEEALGTMFSDSEVSYAFHDGKVILSRKTPQGGGRIY